MGRIRKILKEDSGFVYFLLLTTLLVYSTGWSGEFVSDDIAGIAQNSALGNFWQQLHSLNFNNIVFSVIYNLFGPRPLFFHILNTAIHLTTVIFVYVLVSLLTRRASKDKRKSLSPWVPRLTTLLFALHPIEVEGITWISGIPYAAYTLFLTAAMLAFILAIAGSRASYRRVGMGSLLFILALSASEKAIMFPGILAAYLFIFGKLNGTNIKRMTPILIIFAIFVLGLFGRFGERVAQVAPSYAGGLAAFNPLVQIPIAVYTYIKLIFIPFDLTLYHEFAAFPHWEYWLAVGVTGALLLFLLLLLWKGYSTGSDYKGRGHKLVSFGLSWFVIGLSPTLLPVNVGWIVAERYVHFASIGFFLALSSFVFILTDFKAVRSIVYKYFSFINATAAVVIIAAFLSLISIRRNLEWRSQDTLWPATVRESPHSAYAWNNMGDYYGRHGDIENSIKAFERARELRPRYADATHNLANAYLKINEATKAAELYKEALNYNPTLYQSYEQLGTLALSQGDYISSTQMERIKEDKVLLKSAEEYFIKAAELNPDPIMDYLYLYLTYTKANKKKEARKSLTKAQNLAGNDPLRQNVIQQFIAQYQSI